MTLASHLTDGHAASGRVAAEPSKLRVVGASSISAVPGRRDTHMTTYKMLKNAIITTTFGALLLLGSVIAASAQNADQQYRQWQRAQAEAEQRHQYYLRTGDMRDYRDWQRAQARAQREQMNYQQAARQMNNNRYYNNG